MLWGSIPVIATFVGPYSSTLAFLPIQELTYQENIRGIKYSSCITLYTCSKSGRQDGVLRPSINYGGESVAPKHQDCTYPKLSSILKSSALTEMSQELETLLEKGVIDESVFDTIHSALPEESPLSGPLRTATSSSATVNQARTLANHTPSQNNIASPLLPQAAHAPQQPQQAQTAPYAPPTYEDTPPPGLPNRNINAPAPSKPVIAQARALYRYEASDTRDVSFEKDDPIAVHEYMNADWWMGKNSRTSQEGIFPRNYVLVEQENKQPSSQYPQQPTYGYPAQQAQGPPEQRNPYDSSVPPMAVSQGGQPAGAQGPGGNDKMNQYGKKFGKKLGNAAIFGAGATIGGNIVNSIF